MDPHYNNSTFLPYAQAQLAQHSPLPSYGSQAQSSQPQQQQQQQSQPQHAAPHDSNNNNNNLSTLPPLQGQNGYSQFGGLSFSHNGSGSQTPTTPVSQSVNGYSHLSPASAMPPPQNNYANPYPMTSQTIMYPSTTASSMNSTVTSGPGLPTIRPMPPASISASLASLPSLATHQLGQQSSFLQNEEAPTHVVGSQGRRGILPSAPGRPAVGTTVANASQKSMALQKDADGKFPCPHCTKTYLHAKHLKRHMLRHTGDRPYSCHLCKDTFSRSDILKRHFQKCSIRRGNPSGLSHLAHQRRSGNSENRLSISQQEGPIGLAGLSDVAASNNSYGAAMVDQSTPVTADASNRTSRANSLITPVSMSNRNSLNGLGIVSPNGQSSDSPHPTSHFAAPNMHGYGMPNAGTMSTPYAFSQPSMTSPFYASIHNQQPLPYLNHTAPRYDHSHNNSPHHNSPGVGDQSQAQMEGSRLLAHNAQDSYLNGGVGLDNPAIKPEHDKHFANDFGGDHPPALAQAWS